MFHNLLDTYTKNLDGDILISITFGISSLYVIDAYDFRCRSINLGSNVKDMYHIRYCVWATDSVSDCHVVFAANGSGESYESKGKSY